MSDLISIELTDDELGDMILVADLSLFETIRNDPNCDNIRWVATRIKLIDKLMRANGEEGILMSDLISRKQVIEILENLPSKDQKTGRWVKDNYGNTVCSECLGIRRDNRINYINFCNQCGADMRGGQK